MKYFREVDKKCSGKNNKKWLAISIFVAKILRLTQLSILIV